MFVYPIFGGCKYTNIFLFINKFIEFQCFAVLITSFSQHPEVICTSFCIFGSCESLTLERHTPCRLSRNGSWYGLTERLQQSPPTTDSWRQYRHSSHRHTGTAAFRSRLAEKGKEERLLRTARCTAISRPLP